MKTALWTYSIAVGATSLLVGFLGHMFRVIFPDIFYGRQMPHLTELFLHVQWWAIAVAVPFFVAALYLSTHSRITGDRAFMFAGLSTLAIVALLAFSVVSITLPFVPIFRLHGQ